LIPQTLALVKEMPGTHSPDEIRQFVTHRLNQDSLLLTEYFEIAHEITLKPVKNWSEPGGKIGCVAVRVGNVRLIDNVVFSS
jgi:pantoate--beta-alanine ligase